MITTTRKRTPINYKSKAKSLTIPDQSMSILEIVRRFVRGIPVDVIQRQGVYVDQSEHDLERMSRMDFAEQADMAAHLSNQAQEIADEHNAKEEARKATIKQKAVEDQKRKKVAKKPTGIDSLDNTMPDDTNPENQ